MFCRTVFPKLMVHHFACTNPYKTSIFERSVTCSLFELYLHIEKNLGGGGELEDVSRQNIKKRNILNNFINFLSN